MEAILKASKTKDRIIVWKNFLENNKHLQPFRNFESIKKNLNLNDTYAFLPKYSNRDKIELPLGEALDRMKEKQDLYLGKFYSCF